jgi:hypothetical protein
LRYNFAHHDVGIVCHRGRATKVGEQRFGGYSNLRAWDPVRRGFVTSAGYQLIDNDELGIGRGSDA